MKSPLPTLWHLFLHYRPNNQTLYYFSLCGFFFEESEICECLPLPCDHTSVANLLLVNYLSIPLFYLLFILHIYLKQILNTFIFLHIKIGKKLMICKYVFLCVVCMYAGAHRGLKVTLDTLAPHSRWLVLPYMGAGNWTSGFWKSSTCS